jgi:hypothetical protein
MADTNMSFASRTARAQNFYILIKKFKNYTPPRYEESADGFGELIERIIQANINETKYNAEYRFKVADRRKKFLNGNDSVMRTFLYVRNFVASFYGLNSRESEMIDDIVWKMRTNSYARAKSTVKKEDVKKKRSDADRSYSSMTGNFTEMVTLLKGFRDFNHSDEKYTIDGLTNYLDELKALNDATFNAMLKKDKAKLERKHIFEELKERTTRIKAYVKSKYGTDSHEYKLIKSLRF